jgi:predicted ATP-grasp superfamily ATP-dependent carboligase
MTGGSTGGPSEALNARARRRLIAAAPRWRRPAVVVTNLEGFVGIQTARLMRRHGVPVVALSDRPRDPLSRTRSVDGVRRRPGRTRYTRVLGEIAHLFPARPVLMPCSDIAVAAVSAARAGLDYHLVLPEHDVIELLTDKPRFLDHAQANGIPVSPFRVLHSRSDAEDVAAGLGYPVVMKPYRGTMAWNDRVGQKAVRVFDATRLLETWVLAAPDYPVLVQEWVEGGDDHLYSFNGYFVASGQPLATFIARKVRQWPPHTGMSSLGVECRNDVVLETALRLFASVPYRGFAYLEMKRDAQTGQTTRSGEYQSPDR